MSRSLAGRTLRWKFVDGPTAATIYEHVFRPDGTVGYRQVAGEDTESSAPGQVGGPHYVSWQVAPSTHLVSYLGDSGYTLTVALNFDTRRCYGVASNAKEWYPVTGTVQDVTESASAA